MQQWMDMRQIKVHEGNNQKWITKRMVYRWDKLSKSAAKANTDDPFKWRMDGYMDEEKQWRGNHNHTRAAAERP